MQKCSKHIARLKEHLPYTMRILEVVILVCLDNAILVNFLICTTIRNNFSAR